MSYFDYNIAPTDAGPGEGIRRIGDALTQTISSLRQKEQFEKKQAFDREQEARKFAQKQGDLAYQHRTQDAREKRDDFEFTQKQQKFRSDQAMNVQKAIAAGNPQLAAMIAAETSTFDPKTGQAAHGKLTPGAARDVGPAPQEPPMPMGAPEAPAHPPEIAARRRALALPQPAPDAFVGPIDSPEHARRTGLASDTLAAGKYAGMVKPGNINLTDRPDVLNADGSHSSVRSMSFNVDGHEVLVPTVSEDGRIMTDDEAIRQYMKTGRQLGIFATPAAADAYAQALHEQQAAAGDASLGVQGQTRGRAPYEKAYADAVAANERSGAEQQARLDRYPAELAQAQQDKARYDQQTASLPARQREHAAAAHQAELERPYALQFGDEPPVNMDVGTQRYASREASANDFLASLPANLSPQDRAAAANAHAAILAGDDPQKAIIAYNKERAGISEHGFKDQQGDKRDINRIEVAKINARKPSFTLQEKRFGFEGEKERSKNLRQDLKTWTERYGAKSMQEDHLALPRIESDLTSGNPQRQRNALTQLWQMSQHDHRMSDQDMRMAQTVDPSFLAKIENEISLKSTGVLDSDVQKVAVDTAHSYVRYLNTKLAQMQAMAKEDFLDNPKYDRVDADFLLHQQVPGWKKQTPSSGGPPEVDARRRGASKAGDSKTIKLENVSTDDLLKALGGATP